MSTDIRALNYELDFSQKLPSEAQAAKADGMKAADDHAAPKWRHYFDSCVLSAARKKAEITSDDVLAELESLPQPPETHNLAAIGPAMQRGDDGDFAPDESRGPQRASRKTWKPAQHL